MVRRGRGRSGSGVAEFHGPALIAGKPALLQLYYDLFMFPIYPYYRIQVGRPGAPDCQDAAPAGLTPHQEGPEMPPREDGKGRPEDPGDQGRARAEAAKAEQELKKAWHEARKALHVARAGSRDRGWLT